MRMTRNMIPEFALLETTLPLMNFYHPQRTNDGIVEDALFMSKVEHSIQEMRHEMALSEYLTFRVCGERHL